MMKLIEEGQECPKGKCVAGAPMCDKCDCNFGAEIRREPFDGFSGVTITKVYVKCACQFGRLAGIVKRFFNSW